MKVECFMSQDNKHVTTILTTCRAALHLKWSSAHLQIGTLDQAGKERQRDSLRNTRAAENTYKQLLNTYPARK